jgi:hypothetical protein
MSAKFDKRTIERKMKNGEVTEAEYQAYLSELPDESENAQEMETKFVYYSERTESEAEEK